MELHSNDTGRQLLLPLRQTESGTVLKQKETTNATEAGQPRSGLPYEVIAQDYRLGNETVHHSSQQLLKSNYGTTIIYKTKPEGKTHLQTVKTELLWGEARDDKEHNAEYYVKNQTIDSRKYNITKQDDV